MSSHGLRWRLQPAIQPVARRVVIRLRRVRRLDERPKADGSINAAEPAARKVTRRGLSIRACGVARRYQVESVRSASHSTLQAVSAGIDSDPPVEVWSVPNVSNANPQASCISLMRNRSL